MIYGLYLSATGIMTNSYRQDVVANNLANAETTGFKRDIPVFRQRLMAAQENRTPGSWSDPSLDGLGGGLLTESNHTDFEQGGMEQTGSPLDVAIQGNGFFAVNEKGKTLLTRDGRLQLDRSGALILTSGQPVLDVKGQPITISPNATNTVINTTGQILQDGQVAAQLGVFDVPDSSKLTKLGNGLFQSPDPIAPTTNATLRSEYLESSNVDPTTELADLMDTQRQLEANANMIHTQDSTLQLLVTNVGKIS
ncbi:MAG TPA: flagellar basal-body rod protein FlgF [Tepidisphaeraceae bacterium]|nr:flagellar basal-body rod protein FlgF [Tepidisphaeraceae bacterium]